MKEVWKPVRGYRDRYEVSNKGRIKSLNWTITYTKPSGTVVTIIKIGQVLKASKARNGYMVVNLVSKSGRKTQVYVHRVVAQAFLGKGPEGRNVVRHRDDDGTNNKVSNLKWGKDFDNVLDKMRKGRQLHGSQIAQAKLNEQKVLRIIKVLEESKGTFKSLAERYGVSPGTIKRVWEGKHWKRVTGRGEIAGL